MTQPSETFAATSGEVTQPVPDRFTCQTPKCGQPFRILTFDVESSETMYLCWGCAMAFWLAVLKAMTEQGMLDPDAQTAQPE
jgi:hypothetical protein